MSYNLFLDDIRDPNLFLNDTKTWVVARNHNDFVKIITERGLPDFISFDHDLSDVDQNKTSNFKEKTGYDCAKWLIEYCMRANESLPKWQVHSMNSVGRNNINALLTRYKEREEDIYE